jgi:hypothetical protein
MKGDPRRVRAMRARPSDDERILAEIEMNFTLSVISARARYLITSLGYLAGLSLFQPDKESHGDLYGESSTMHVRA